MCCGGEWDHQGVLQETAGAVTSPEPCPGSCCRSSPARGFHVVVGIPARVWVCSGVSSTAMDSQALFWPILWDNNVFRLVSQGAAPGWELWARSFRELGQGWHRVMAQRMWCLLYAGFQLLVAMPGLCWAAECLRRSLAGSGGCRMLLWMELFHPGVPLSLSPAGCGALSTLAL